MVKNLLVWILPIAIIIIKMLITRCIQSFICCQCSENNLHKTQKHLSIKKYKK